jgi:hypothetical protein
MSLAFALMAAINGSTGSSAILTYGLNGTKPHRRQPDGDKILTAQRRRRKPSETLTCESPYLRARLGSSVCRRRSVDDRSTGDRRGLLVVQAACSVSGWSTWSRVTA